MCLPRPLSRWPGVEADVGDEFFGAFKAPDIADDGEEGKGVDLTNAEQFHAA
jgi:hypothetical protein